jgi:hypothetical protein
MNKLTSAGLFIAIFATVSGSLLTGCNDYIGSAGKSGIDTVWTAEAITWMTTTDSTLIPVLDSPAMRSAGVTPRNPIMQWTRVAAASRYRLVVSPDAGFNTLVVNDSAFTSADSTSRQIYALSGSSTYYWCVAAMGANGKIGWSHIFHFTTQPDSSLVSEQNAYVSQQFGMFIHFGMSTFARWPYPTPDSEWEVGGEDPNLFHPDSLNCGQWADVAKSAHCKYVVLTTRHHGGFCLWPTRVQPSASNHTIALSSWYQTHGQRDICREFVDSVRSRGMEPGFYYSIWDRTNAVTIPMVKGELTELLSNYGDIKVIWFDGWGWMVGYIRIPYDTVANLVHYLNDSLGHHTIISENNHHYKMWNTEIVQYEIPIDGPPQVGNVLPSEGNEPLRTDGCWFWHPMDSALKTPSFIYNRIQSCLQENATYLLDVTPDTLGLIPGYQVQQMQAIGATVQPLLH